ncbi:tripartite tricarboxylate transporter substrate binding protein [Fodinicurvata sp. EGI_FJ10296]|uniref:Bug family tripartite tricarboxylate transporter substrate binding protein n=1 Tax=Fodinicurvata sp. EGI_FJ10296 TaxID=3231908 RepID=UPI0034543A9C
MNRKSSSLSVAGSLVGLALPAAMVAGPAHADTGWTPSEPVEYIAPANPGGGWDTLVRTTSQVIQENELAPVNFPPINVPGGGGAVAWAQIAADAGNPHKLFATSPPIILVPLSGQSEYNHQDFTPIARLITDYAILLVRADSPYETASDLFDAIEENPSLAVGGGSAPGSMDHIAAADAAQAAGIDASTVNYIAFSGGGEAMTNLLGGHVEAVMTGAGEAVGQLEGDDIRALGVSAPERIDALPDVPTFEEQGIDHTFEIWRGVMGPPDMPEEAVAYYEELFAEVLETESWIEARDQLGWLNAYQNSEEFGEFLDGQLDQFESILSDLGLLEQ